jgi:putative membrane protein
MNSQQPTNITNELAKQRNRAAAERTLIGWIQNCLTLIGFGIAFDRIFSAVNQTFASNDTALNAQIAQIIGLGAIALGIFLLVLAIISYTKDVQSISQADYLYQPIHTSTIFVITAIVLFGLIAIVAIFTSAVLLSVARAVLLPA